MAVEIDSNFHSPNAIVLSKLHLESMSEILKAVEAVLNCKEYQTLVTSRLPHAGHDFFDTSELFVAYDFHVNDQGVGLIEINTNPGGALLSAVISSRLNARDQKHPHSSYSFSEGEEFESELVPMFEREWKKFNPLRLLKSIAIIDENPEQQFLYPEFLLFQELFIKNGIDCEIADPSELTLKEDSLWVKDLRIDLVYNRLTDFYLAWPSTKIIRQAYVEKIALVTPNPRAYSRYADKRNLAILSDKALLASFGITKDIQKVLGDGIPATQEVNGANAEALWANRRNLFFKPINGFGGRAVYRGDKITKKVWSMILQGSYVAQQYFAPGEISLGEISSEKTMKYDVRLVADQGRVLWVSGRVYQGQATNFRTPGGGFAQVVIAP